MKYKYNANMLKVFILLGAIFIVIGGLALWNMRLIPYPSVTNPPFPPSTVCGIQECHGMELTCGSQPADICTEIFMVGDGCRTFFECGVTNGICAKTEDRRFDSCTSCVKQCVSDNKGDDVKISECDSYCVAQVEKLK